MRWSLNRFTLNRCERVEMCSPPNDFKMFMDVSKKKKKLGKVVRNR